MKRSSMEKRRPFLEVLEDRTCPTCLVELSGTTLKIIGDDTANDISIFYFPGELSLMCDGTPTQITDPVEKVVVKPGKGNDFVYSELYPDGQDTAFPGSWTFDLGDGKDQSAFHVLGFFSIDYPLTVNVSGGNGNDTMFTEIIGLLNTDVVENVQGGNGNDNIFNFYSGEVFGTMTTSTQAGNGDDFVLEEYTLWKVFGEFDATVKGGNGSDRLEAHLGDYILLDPELPPGVIGFNVAPGARADYHLEGGNDHDALMTKYVGLLDGDLNILAEGGNGDDEFFADYQAHEESTGILKARHRGGNGNDTMNVQMRFFETQQIEFPDMPGFFMDGLAGYVDDPGLLAGLCIKANGGNGFDTCLHSALVHLIKVEDHQVI